MLYLKNRSINLLNIHMLVFMLGFDVGWIFGPIFLYKLGVPVYQIFLVQSLTFIFRTPARLLITPFVFKYGLKPIINISLFGLAASFLCLMNAKGLDGWFWAYLCLYTPFLGWYWLNYHVLYANLGESKHRGKDISMRMILTMMGGIMGPILNGFIIKFYGFKYSFMLAAALLVLSGLFIALLKENPIPKKEPFKAIRPHINWNGFNLFASSGFGHYAQVFCWQLVLFIMLKDTLSFGGILGYVVFVQMVLQLFLGKAVDQGKGKALADIGFLGDSAITATKALLAYSLPMILTLEIGQSFTKMLRTTTDTVLFLNEGKNSSHPYWYQFLAEAGWDMGAAMSLILCGVLHYHGVPLRGLMLLGIIGVLSAWRIVRGYYKH